MIRKIQGHQIPISTVGEEVRAFVPNPLPPSPPIDWYPELREKFDEAFIMLGRLDSVSTLLPDTSLFLDMYVRKEAVLSSMIEGTQSSLSDLLLFELDQNPGVPPDDVQEVSNYVVALDYGLNQIKKGFPLCLRLLREMHGFLLSKGRGSKQSPGEFRKSQNWIGGSRPGNAVFVPPPAEYVLECMGQVELFLHNKPEKTSALLKAALAHIQFETIHPFLDGNGRLGRLLISLILCNEKILNEPLLYLSLYFKTYRQKYYALLNEVRLTGNWEEWLIFFAEAVIETSIQAYESAQNLVKLSRLDNDRIQEIGRLAGSVQRIHRYLLERPIASPIWLQTRSNLSMATINKCLKCLVQIGIVHEITGKKRNRLFAYSEYIDILNQGIVLK